MAVRSCPSYKHLPTYSSDASASFLVRDACAACSCVRANGVLIASVAAVAGAGTYGDIYNFPMQQYESALDEVWRGG